MTKRPATAVAAALALAGAALAVCATAGLRSPAPAAAEEGPGNPARGRAVYEADCVHCHKPDGTGGVKVTAAGSPARSFATAEFWRGRSDAQLYRAIEAGYPKSGMVARRGVLKPQQIRDVIAYLRAAFQPRERAAEGRPAGQKK